MLKKSLAALTVAAVIACQPRSDGIHVGAGGTEPTAFQLGVGEETRRAKASAPTVSHSVATAATQVAAEPDPEPAVSPKPAPIPGSADLDPDNDGVVAPPDSIDRCEALLDALQVSFKSARLPLRQTRHGASCGKLATVQAAAASRR